LGDWADFLEASRTGIRYREGLYRSKRTIIDTDDALFLKLYIIETEVAAMKGHGKSIVNIMIQICACTDIKSMKP